MFYFLFTAIFVCFCSAHSVLLLSSCMFNVRYNFQKFFLLVIWRASPGQKYGTINKVNSLGAPFGCVATSPALTLACQSVKRSYLPPDLLFIIKLSCVSKPQSTASAYVFEKLVYLPRRCYSILQNHRF